MHSRALPQVWHTANSPDLDCAVTTADFNFNQANDAYCNQIALWISEMSSVYLYNRNGLFVRHSKVDPSIQKVVPGAFYDLIFYLSHYPVLAGYPRERSLKTLNVKSFTCLIKPMPSLLPYRITDHGPHKERWTVTKRNYDRFLRRVR